MWRGLLIKYELDGYAVLADILTATAHFRVLRFAEWKGGLGWVLCDEINLLIDA